METYTILPHTADAKIHLKSDSLEGLFRSGMKGLNRIMFHNSPTSKPTITKQISITSADHTSLLVEFISEILKNSFIERAIFHQLNILSLGKNTLSAQISGSPVSNFKKDVKAVSYHGAEITEKNGIYETDIIFDI